MSFEYRVGWSASSVHAFKGESEWMEWGGFEGTVEEVEEALNEGNAICEGLEQALDLSGFEWWSEVREARDEAGA